MPLICVEINPSGDSCYNCILDAGGDVCRAGFDRSDRDNRPNACRENQRHTAVANTMYAIHEGVQDTINAQITVTHTKERP